jgi:colicin import membrane protein
MRRCALLPLAAFFGVLMASAHAQLDVAAERARIAQERAAAGERLREREKACATRFVVTSCVEAARREHRETLAPLKQQEFLLDDAQRQLRAAQRRAQLQEKAAQTKSDIVLPSTQPAAAEEAASAPTRRPASPAKTLTPQEQAQIDQERARKQAASQVEAQQRAHAHQQKLEVAKRRKQEVEKRNAERAASGKPPPAPLKMPPSASAP